MEVGALPGLASPLSAFSSCGREGVAAECGTMLASESLLSPELDSLSPLDGLLCSATSDTSDAPWLQGGGGGDGSIGDATLLMALAETLDSLDDNTASPFDGLLDPEPRLLACDVEESSTLKRLLLSPVSGAESRVASTRNPYSVTTRLPTSPGRHANRPRQRHPTPTYLELLRHLCTLESAAYSPVGSSGSAVCDWEGSGSSGEDMPEKRDGSAEGFCASGESGASSSSSNDEDDIGMLLPEGDVEELQKLMAMDGSFEFDVIDLKEGSVVELVSYMHTYCVRDSVASLSLLSPVKAPCAPAVLAGGMSPDGGSSSASLAGSSSNVGGSEGGEEQARGTDDGGDGGTAANGTGFLGPLDGLCESSSLDCSSEKASLGRDAKEQAEGSAGAVAATGTAAPAAATPGPEEISAATFPAAKAEREDEAGAKAENGNAVPFAVPQKRPRGRPRTRNINGQQEPGAAAAAAAAAMTKKAVRSILFEEPPRRSVRISKAKKETRQSDAAQRGQARPPPERVAHPALARVDFNRTTAEVETKPVVVVQQQQLKLSKVIGGLAVSSSSTSLMTRPAPSSLSAPSALVSVSAPSPLPASASSVSISSPAPSSAIAKPTPSALVTPPTVMTLSSPVPPPLLTTLSSMPPPSSSPSSSLATPSSSTPPSSVLPSSTAPSSRTPPLSTLSVAPSPSVPSVELSTVPPSLSAPPSTSMTPPLSPASSAPPPDGEAPPAPLVAVPPDANAEEESGAKRRRISLLQYRRRMEERGLELGPQSAGGAGVQLGLAEQSGADDAASAEQLGRDESKAAAVGAQAVLPADAPAEAAAESMEDDNYLETDPTIRAFFEEIGIEASDLGSLLQQFEESEGKRREVPESTATRTVGTLGQAHVQDVGMELELSASEVRETPGVIAPSTSLHPKPDAKVNLASRGTSAKRKAPRSPRKRGIPVAGKMPRLEAATKQPCSGQLAPSTRAAAQAASGRFAPAAGTVPTAGARMIPPLPAGVDAAAQDPPCVSAPNAVGPVKLSKVEQTLPPARASLGVASPSVVADKMLSLPASQPVVNRTPPCQSDALPYPVRVAIPAAATTKMLSSTKLSLVPAVAGKPPAAANPSCASVAAVLTAAVQLDIVSRVSAANLPSTSAQASPLVTPQVVNGCSASKSEIGVTRANGAVVERVAEIQIPNVRDHDYCQQSTAGSAAATVSESAGAPANADPRRDEAHKLKRQYRTRAPGGGEASRGSSPPAHESSCCSTSGGGSSSSSGGDSDDDEPGYYDKLPGYYRSGKSLPEPKYQPLRADRAAAGLAEGRERGSRRSTCTTDEYSSASDEERSPGKAARHRRYYSKLPVYLSAASKVSNLPYADCGQETANSDTDTSGGDAEGRSRSRHRRTRSRGSQDRRCGEGRHRAPTSAAGGGSLSSSPGRRDSVSPPSAAAASPHQRGRQRSRSRSGYGRRYRSSGGGRSSSSTTTSSHRRSVSPVPSFSSDVPRSRRPSPRYDAYERRSERPWLERRESNILDQRRRLHQKAIEERRVIYVGKINSGMTTLELRRRFQSFGEIENCSVHFRERGDNYGFVTYRFTCDAFAALEKGHMVHLPNEIPFDLCFGGRRQFCKASYADLDSNRGLERSTDRRTAMAPLDFDSLLKAAKQHSM